MCFDFVAKRRFGDIDDFLVSQLYPCLTYSFRDIHLKRLRIPVLHFLDRGHLVQSIGKVVQFLDAVCETDRQLFGEELRSSKQSTYYHQHRH